MHNARSLQESAAGLALAGRIIAAPWTRDRRLDVRARLGRPAGGVGPEPRVPGRRRAGDADRWPGAGIRAAAAPLPAEGACATAPASCYA